MYDVEYVEAEKVYSVQKIPILNLDNKKKEICISDRKSVNQETPQKRDLGKNKPYQVNQ